MSFSNAFINVANVNENNTRGPRISPPMGVMTDGLVPLESPRFDSTLGRSSGVPEQMLKENALWFQTILREVGAGATFYFPPGRYYLGRPWPDGPLSAILDQPGTGTEAFGDFVVPPGVVLKFAPGAALVPYDYSWLPAPERDRWAWGVPGRPWERYKVRLEIQGGIDAGAQQIFDVLLENLNDQGTLDRLIGLEPRPREIELFRQYYTRQLHPAGLVFLTLNSVRAVYPEWWGAAPPPLVTGEVAAVIRRTTLAIQAAIDAGHTHRHLNVMGTNMTPRTATPPAVAPAHHRASIPILFSREYVIDRELMAGQSWWEAERLASPALSASDQLLVSYQVPNTDPIILRGVRGPTRRGAGAAQIRASRNFFMKDDRTDRVDPDGVNPDRADGARFFSRRSTHGMPASDALLAVRGPSAFVIEGIEFDAASTAARCLTLEWGTVSLSPQSDGVERCAFKNATSQLVHIGGEPHFLMVVAGTNKPGVFPTMMVDPNYTPHTSPGQDLTGLRFVRCTFETGTLQDPPTVGVLMYADEALGVEFHRCAFGGPAAPMCHVAGGRMQFDGCSFHTLEGRGSGVRLFPGTDYEVPPAGLDIFLDVTPLIVWDDSAGVRHIDRPVPMGVCVLRDVHSRSPRLIASTSLIHHSQGVPGAVLLIRVTHDPMLLASVALPPAIVWGSVGMSGARLVLMGCRFVRPDRRMMPGSVMEPVQFFFGRTFTNRASFVGSVDDGLGVWALNTHSKGHVIDLGTRIEMPGAVVPRLISTEAMQEHAATLGGPVLRSAVTVLPVFEQFTTRMVP